MWMESNVVSIQGRRLNMSAMNAASHIAAYKYVKGIILAQGVENSAVHAKNSVACVTLFLNRLSLKSKINFLSFKTRGMRWPKTIDTVINAARMLKTESVIFAKVYCSNSIKSVKLVRNLIIWRAIRTVRIYICTNITHLKSKDIVFNVHTSLTKPISTLHSNFC